MLPRAQIAGRIFTLWSCLIAVKLLDLSRGKNSQIGLQGRLKGLGGSGWRNQRKELSSTNCLLHRGICLPPRFRISQKSLWRLCKVRGHRIFLCFVLTEAWTWRTCDIQHSAFFFLLLFVGFLCQWLLKKWPGSCLLLRGKCVKNFESLDEFSEGFDPTPTPGKPSESDVHCFTSFSYLFFFLFNLDN